MSDDLQIATLVLPAPRLAFLRRLLIQVEQAALPASIILLAIFIDFFSHKAIVSKKELSGYSAANQPHDLRV
jgi:hypothetical protein